MSVTDRELTDLAASHDIISLGVAADEIRRQRHGMVTTFVRVAAIAADTSSEVRVPGSAGEIRLVGVPASRQAAIERVRDAVAAAAGIPVSGFSLADLEQLAATEHCTLRALLEEMHAAGLELVAEAPIDRLSDSRRAIEQVNIAGLTLARLTVDQLPADDSLRLFREAADLQRDIAVLRAFAPLPRRVNPAVPTTGYEDIRRVALARIVVDNVPSIQVDWSLYGPKLAQVALTVGADDVDGVSAEDDLSQGYRRSPLEEILRNIRATGYEPVERTGRFERRNE